eukprot:tig00021036_g17378.t1
MPPRRRGRKKKPESSSESEEEEPTSPSSESEEEEEEEEEEPEPKPKGKGKGKGKGKAKGNAPDTGVDELETPVVEIPKRYVLVQGEDGIFQQQKSISDYIKLSATKEVQMLPSLLDKSYHEPATLWSIHSEIEYDKLPEERLRAIPRTYQSAQKSPPICYRCLRLMYEATPVPSAKGANTPEKIAAREAAQARKDAVYEEYVAVIEKANAWAAKQNGKGKKKGQEPYPLIKDKKPAQVPTVSPRNSWLCQKCVTLLGNKGLLVILGLQRRKRGDTATVSKQTRDHMVESVLGGPKPKTTKKAKDTAADFGSSVIEPNSAQSKIRKAKIVAPSMEDLMATFADAQEVKQNIEKAKTGLQAAQANGLEALEKVITEISETGRSVFILNKKNPDGSTRYDIRQARQSRYWVLFNTHKRLGEAREFEAAALRDSLAEVLSDAEFYKFIRFNLKEENGKYKDDTYANAIIGIRVQGGVEVGPTDGALHAHVLVTIDHISNLQVLWANYDWVVLLKEKEPGTTTVYERLHQILSAKFTAAGQRLVDQKRAEAGPQPSIDTMVEIAELERMLTEEKIGMGKDPPTVLASLIPEENYASKLQEYLSKTLPDKQRRDLLKEWSHARNTNNTDNNTDGYLFTIFQADAGQADDPRFAPQAAEIGDLRARGRGRGKGKGRGRGRGSG